jgi:hypothetical protein
MNPVHYIFDLFKMDEGILEVAHSIPYSDVTSLSNSVTRSPTCSAVNARRDS